MRALAESIERQTADQLRCIDRLFSSYQSPSTGTDQDSQQLYPYRFDRALPEVSGQAEQVWGFDRQDVRRPSFVSVDPTHQQHLQEETRLETHPEIAKNVERLSTSSVQSEKSYRKQFSFIERSLDFLDRKLVLDDDGTRSLRTDQDRDPSLPCLRWVQGQNFDVAAGLVILVNAFVMCMELEYRGRVQAHDRLESSLSSEDYDPPQWPAMEHSLVVLEFVFCIVFFLELVLRIVAFRTKFFASVANWMDALIVFLNVCRLFVSNVPNLTFVRLVRIIRLTKVLRVVRTLRLFHPLRLLLVVIRSSLGTLSWSVVFLSMAQFISGIFMTLALHTWIMDIDNELADRKELFQYFGTVSRSLVTMLEVTLAPGSWAKLGRFLIFKVSPLYFIVVALYGWLVIFTVLGLIRALFLKHALAAAAVNPEEAMVEKGRKRKREESHMRRIFQNLDVDLGGTITMDEFRGVLVQPMMRTLLSILEVDTQDIEGLFHLLDDGDGHIHLEELIAGVMRIRGQARSMDVVSLQIQTKRVQTQLRNIRELIEPRCAPGIISQASHRPRPESE